MWQSTTSRISAGGESVHPEKSARPGRTGRWLAAGLLLLLSAMLPSLAWAAAYATGGSSPYRNTVLWLTWGGGTDLGTHGVTLNNGDTSSISIPIASGIDLNVTCSWPTSAVVASCRAIVQAISAVTVWMTCTTSVVAAVPIS